MVIIPSAFTRKPEQYISVVNPDLSIRGSNNVEIMGYYGLDIVNIFNCLLISVWVIRPCRD